MTGERWVVAVLMAMAVGVGCQSTQYPPTSEGYYLRYCARCHEPDGSSVTASELADSPVDLRDRVFQSLVTDADIERIVVYGQGRMQGLDLPDAVVDSIVVHVRSLAADPDPVQ
jgi:hypothetical protein